ncbi:protein RALF-like 34 [Diospyros lotus]|uniref:protein RALF-like 34 n=1 Tax=Diospyros lotus TaxID=55363 RepID=UPI0022597757|nr:protein RALF-like 34 [Diospyros lotus]
MATSNLLRLVALCILLLWASGSAGAQADVFDWQSAMSMYEFGGEEGLSDGDPTERRSLFWHKLRFYISYGALSANRIPCPPRSGRSYYTHNCFKARGPVHPYTRGCSAITRCRK